MKLTGLALVALLLLTGCTPSTDAAQAKCYDTLVLPFKLDSTLSTDEFLTKALAIREGCAASAKADPAAFIKQWG